LPKNGGEFREEALQKASVFSPFLGQSEGSENFPKGSEKLPESSEIQIRQNSSVAKTAMKKELKK
jgi:hypothetical protein